MEVHASIMESKMASWMKTRAEKDSGEKMPLRV